ncbi:hypothetical protein PHLCEN_2v13101 [Hermanssonia centrifuga]|uniref:Uncharacterized protein n=1 Tax=Hermanssonia centrifuga TaxID=98765 RepID=A0A2R6NF35_9APHY|nr:hypothetical protein PHLCEN_2v13101 [Hermanssonia centrifuga]
MDAPKIKPGMHIQVRRIQEPRSRWMSGELRGVIRARLDQRSAPSAMEYVDLDGNWLKWSRICVIDWADHVAGVAYREETKPYGRRDPRLDLTYGPGEDEEETPSPETLASIQCEIETVLRQYFGRR